MESGGRRRNRVFDFVKKAYEMVDDPSTDSIVSWGPDGRSFIVWKRRECARDLIAKLLQITTFGRFETYGFRKIVTGEEHLEFACNDFVRGKPELLEKIGERYVAQLQAFHDKRYKPLEDRLKNCKNREEVELALKEQKEIFEKESKERKEAIAMERARRLIRTKRLEDQLQHVLRPFDDRCFCAAIYIYRWDPLHQLRQAARDAIDAFLDDRIVEMQAYIEDENNVHNLQNAINQLNLMNNAITDPALMAEDVAVEVLNEEELEEVRGIARQSVIETRNRIPGIINYINRVI